MVIVRGSRCLQAGHKEKSLVVREGDGAISFRNRNRDLKGTLKEDEI